MKQLRFALFALLLAAFVWQAPFAPRAQADTKTKPAAKLGGLAKVAQAVTLYRDAWGVPHVYGPNDYSVMFGFLYAQCEDNFWQVEDSYLQALGRASEVYGDKMLVADIVKSALRGTAIDVQRVQEA